MTLVTKLPRLHFRATAAVGAALLGALPNSCEHSCAPLLRVIGLGCRISRLHIKDTAAVGAALLGALPNSTIKGLGFRILTSTLTLNFCVQLFRLLI